MPYLFPNEHLFVLVTAGLIIALLVIRVRYARRRKKAKILEDGHDVGSNPDQT